MSQAILHPNLLDSCVRDELNNTATRYDSLIPACVRHLVMFLQSYGRSRSGQGCGRESGWCTGELASSSLCFRRTVHCTVAPLICVFFTGSGSWSFEHTSPPRKGRTQGVLWSVQSVHWCFWLQGGIYTASHAHNTCIHYCRAKQAYLVVWTWDISMYWFLYMLRTLTLQRFMCLHVCNTCENACQRYICCSSVSGDGLLWCCVGSRVWVQETGSRTASWSQTCWLCHLPPQNWEGQVTCLLDQLLPYALRIIPSIPANVLLHLVV